MKTLRILASIVLLGSSLACSEKTPPVPPPENAPAAEESPAPAPPVDAGVSSMLDLETEQFLQLNEPWAGDFHEIAGVGLRRILNKNRRILRRYGDDFNRRRRRLPGGFLLGLGRAPNQRERSKRQYCNS